MMPFNFVSTSYKGIQSIIPLPDFQFIIIVGIMLIGAAFAFPISYLSASNVLLGFVLLPFTFFCNKEQRINYAYFMLMLFFAIIAFIYHVRIFYFFSLAFFTLFLVELFIGKCNQLLLFLLVFMSPFFHQVVSIMGFPIRLQLSTIAGNALSTMGINISVEGNMMLLDGAAFTVDEACMGLNMLATSMLMGVFVIGYLYRVNKKRLSHIRITIFFTIILLLNILCNLLRIIILVAFKIVPENAVHEIVGILCFCMYVMVPIYFFSSWMIVKFGKEVIVKSKPLLLNRFGKLSLLTLSLIIMFVGIHIYKEKEKIYPTIHASASLPGFKSMVINDGITKLYNEETLVYIKPIPEFFTGEHTPLLCWQGSGYLFKGIKKSIINGQEIYTCKLSKPGCELFTAWWYSNGKTKTIDQIDWRYRMLKGENKFSLINVTVKDEALLNKSLDMILKESL